MDVCHENIINPQNFQINFRFSYISESKSKMVVGETNGTGSVPGPGPEPAPQQPFGLQQATIDNIMSGIENTGAVKMNNHRKKLRQRFGKFFP